MATNYWLHRISHESECSYPLCEQGILTIGWRSYANSSLLKEFRRGGEDAFHAFMEASHDTSRSRFSLMKFLTIAPGDQIVVPLYNKQFAIYRATSMAQSIANLPFEKFENKKLENWNGHEVSLQNEELCTDTHVYDLGFFIEVEPVSGKMDRSIAMSSLISRMKIRQTTANVNDLQDEIEQVPYRTQKTYFSVKPKLADLLLKDIKEHCSPDDLERLVLWYMKKLGASAHIPAKNASGKTDYADADVVAEFENINVIIYVQVKNHSGQTSDWAIKQVERYAQQTADVNSEYTYINWVISTADFSDKTIEKGKEKNVVLINGSSFAGKLLDVGLVHISDFLK